MFKQLLGWGFHRTHLGAFALLDLSQLLTVESLEQVNKGALTELFVGLELLKSAPSNSSILLHYWQREKAGSNADIVPVEVKSGTKGSMQSMFQFLSEKEYTYGIRCSMENLNELQEVLHDYYCNKVEEESKRIWKEKNLSNEVMHEWLNTHMRTPYNK